MFAPFQTDEWHPNKAELLTEKYPVHDGSRLLLLLASVQLEVNVLYCLRWDHDACHFMLHGNY